MRNRTAIRERYLRDPLPVRLGGLAANLARVESFSDHPEHGEVVERLIEETKFFIEWTAFDAGEGVREQLVAYQRQLALWQVTWAGIWSDLERRSAVAKQAGSWSRRILGMSGLLPE